MEAAKNAPLTGGPVEKSYASRVQDLLSSSLRSAASADRVVDLVELLRQPDKSRTKIFYTNRELHPQDGTPSDLVAFSADDQKSRTEAICVIENISPGFIEELGSAWNLDPEFFIGHAENPNPEDLWVNHFAEYDVRKYRHLDGVFEYHGMRGQKGLDSSPNYFTRHCFEERTYPVQSNTRISYYRVRQGLCESTNRDIENT
jgi:hypothetical protein